MKPVPKRLKAARRWQWPAALASAFFAAACFILLPLGYWQPAAIGLFGFLPAVWLFNIKCHRCGSPAFADYQADEKLKLDERVWTRIWGKEYGGIHLPLKSACTKCGAPFV